MSRFRQFQRKYLGLLRGTSIAGKDVRDTLLLGWMITQLDSMLFGIRRAHVLGVPGMDPNRKLIASWSNRQECYFIYPRGLHHRLQKHWATQRLYLSRITRQPVTQRIKPTFVEMIAGIAAHEVRHRVQLDRDGQMRPFVPSSPLPDDDVVLATILKVLADGYPQYCVQMMNRKLDSELKTSLVSVDEFDAVVIEQMAMQYFAWSASLRDLVPLLRLEPAPISSEDGHGTR